MTPPIDEPARPASDGVELAPGVFVPESALRFQYARSSGPGGQNVNKVNSKVELWIPIIALVALSPSALERLKIAAGRRLTDAGEIHISSDSHRTQAANRQAALERLRELIVSAMHEPKRRRKTRPSRAAKQRRLQSKKRRAEIKSNRRPGAADW
jgi:ribosome-associated protein